MKISNNGHRQAMEDIQDSMEQTEYRLYELLKSTFNDPNVSAKIYRDIARINEKQYELRCAMNPLKNTYPKKKPERTNHYY